MYRNLNDLSYDEVAELKASLYFNLLSTGDLPEEIDVPEDIPDEMLVELYSDTVFVSDDFFCNL